MNGLELARELRTRIPDLPVIFLSGYTDVPGAPDAVRTLGAPLLAKPATMAQLERAIDKVCDTPADSG
jgi:FixJ family two-component response regulator